MAGSFTRNASGEFQAGLSSSRHRAKALRDLRLKTRYLQTAGDERPCNPLPEFSGRGLQLTLALVVGVSFGGSRIMEVARRPHVALPWIGPFESGRHALLHSVA